MLLGTFSASSLEANKKQQVCALLPVAQVRTSSHASFFFSPPSCLLSLHRHDEQDRMERRERDKQQRAFLQAERDAEPAAPIFAAPVKVVSCVRNMTS